MSKKYSTEILRRVYDDTEGVCIQIGPDADGLGIEISTPTKESAEFYGQIRFCIEREMARQIGEALIAAAKDYASSLGEGDGR